VFQAERLLAIWREHLRTCLDLRRFLCLLVSQTVSHRNRIRSFLYSRLYCTFGRAQTQGEAEKQVPKQKRALSGVQGRHAVNRVVAPRQAALSRAATIGEQRVRNSEWRRTASPRSLRKISAIKSLSLRAVTIQKELRPPCSANNLNRLINPK
jgi:hypothetical protein